MLRGGALFAPTRLLLLMIFSLGSLWVESLSLYPPKKGGVSTAGHNRRQQLHGESRWADRSFTRRAAFLVDQGEETSANETLSSLWEMEFSTNLSNVVDSPSSSTPEGVVVKTGDTDAVWTPEFRRRRFAGVGRLYGTRRREDPDRVLDRLQAATVAVVGLGGVGSWAAEALCRSGVGGLVLIDLDDICVSNTNRQVHTTASTVGKLKIDAMRDRLQLIHPDCRITLIHDFITAENVQHIIGQQLPQEYNVTVVLDAIDSGADKAALLAACATYNLPVVTCGGAAGLTDPTRIVCHDLARVRGDKLLAQVRKTLRKEHGFCAGVRLHEQAKLPANSPITFWNIPSVYSLQQEESSHVQGAEPNDENYTPSSSNSFRRCDGSLGTACFVTGTFGFVAAAQVIEMIVHDACLPPSPR